MIIPRKLLQLLPDKLYIQLLYFKHFHRFVNFKHPVSFNEKLQWLKIYDRKPLYTTLVDKLKVKEYLREVFGEDYTIPTLAVWDRPEEIDFDALPNQFVLKWNHDSGSIVICKDKSKFDKAKALKKLQHGAKYNGFWYGREWPYKNVIPKLIAEDYLDGGDDLIDYKLMCFNGEVKCIFTCTQRCSDAGLHVTFYDLDWNLLPFTRNHPREEKPMPKPVTLSKMIKLAEIIAQELMFARIDFYEVDGRLFFGEITFYPGSGLEPFEPKEWDRKLGDWIKLPTDN